MKWKSAWDLVQRTVVSWVDINAPRLGASLAFYTMLSIAPLLVICIAIAGLAFGRQAAQGSVVAQIEGLVGYQGGKAIQSLLLDAAKPASSIFATALGVVTLLFGASGVFAELRDSLNLVWGVKSAGVMGLKGFVRYRFVSFMMVLAIGFLLMVSLVLSAAIAAAGKFFSQFLPAPEAVLHLGTVALSFVAMTVLFALLYKLVPDVPIEWQDVWIGAAVTAALFSIGKFLIALYLGKASVGSAYGAAGSLVVFLVWVYYSSQIFFLGAQFTRVYAQTHGSRAPARGDIPVEIRPSKSA